MIFSTVVVFYLLLYVFDTDDLDAAAAADGLDSGGTAAAGVAGTGAAVDDETADAVAGIGATVDVDDVDAVAGVAGTGAAVDDDTADAVVGGAYNCGGDGLLFEEHVVFFGDVELAHYLNFA